MMSWKRLIINMESNSWTLWFKHLGCNELLYFSKKRVDTKGKKHQYKTEGDYTYYREV